MLDGLGPLCLVGSPGCVAGRQRWTSCRCTCAAAAFCPRIPLICLPHRETQVSGVCVALSRHIFDYFFCLSHTQPTSLIPNEACESNSTVVW